MNNIDRVVYPKGHGNTKNSTRFREDLLRALGVPLKKVEIPSPGASNQAILDRIFANRKAVTLAMLPGGMQDGLLNLLDGMYRRLAENDCDTSPEVINTALSFIAALKETSKDHHHRLSQLPYPEDVVGRILRKTGKRRFPREFSEMRDGIIPIVVTNGLIHLNIGKTATLLGLVDGNFQLGYTSGDPKKLIAAVEDRVRMPTI